MEPYWIVQNLNGNKSVNYTSKDIIVLYSILSTPLTIGLIVGAIFMILKWTDFLAIFEPIALGILLCIAILFLVVIDIVCLVILIKEIIISHKENKNL